MKLGELLLEEHLITPEQLEAALSEQRARGGVLGTILVRLGFVREDAIAAALARKFGIGCVDLDETHPEPVAAARTFADLPRTRAAKLRCCPLQLRNRTLTLAMADPTNVALLDEVSARTGFVVEPVFASWESILRALRSLGPRSRPRFPRVRRFRDPVDFVSGTDIGTLTFARAEPAKLGPGATKEARLADALLVDSARARASSVHVELFRDFFRVRYRLEGALRVLYQRSISRSPGFEPRAVVERILLVSSLDPGSIRAQSGAFTARFEAAGAAREVDFEVDFLPILDGARLVLHRKADRGDLDEPLVPPTEAARNRALMSAVKNGETRFVSALLRAGASPDVSHRGDTPVLAAARQGRVEVVERLLEAGANPRARAHGLDALMLGAFGGHRDCVRRLLASGAFDDDSRGFALDLAAREGHLEVVDDLLPETEIDVGLALLSASLRDRAQVVRRLLRETGPGEEVQLFLALDGAAYTGALEAAKALIEVLPEAESREPFVTAAIRGATDSQIPGSLAGHLRSRFPPDGHAAVVRALVDSSNPELREGFLSSCLSQAVSTGNSELVRVLLEAGADPGAGLAGGSSPLTAAIERNDAGSYELLLDAGAALTLEDLKRLGSASRSGLLALLRSRDAIPIRPEDLLAALRWASEEAHADFALRVDAGAIARGLVEEARGASRRGEAALDLSDLQLRRLPPEVFDFDRFKRLDLSGNELEEIPAEIGNLRNLEELDLSRNPLGSLPAELGSLERLRSIRIRSARFRALPSCVTELAALESLDVSGNSLESLPEELSRVPIRTMHIEFNALESFPEALLRMSSLQSLDVAGNRLAEIPEAIGELKELRFLDLSRNPLGGLPAALGELALLERLEASSTGLQEIPDELGRLERLVRLNLSHNRLLRLPDSLFELPDLEELELEGNDFLALPPSLYRHRIRLDFPRIPAYLVSERLFDLLGLELLERIHLALGRESIRVSYEPEPPRQAPRKPRRRRIYRRRRR